MRKLLIPFLYYKYLIAQLTLKSIKARYKQSVFGYFWILLTPFLQLLVYSFVFSIIYRFPLEVPYPIFLFIGLLPWMYFQNSITNAATVLVDNSELLKKVYFPREVLIYSVILSKAVDFFFASLTLLVLLLIYQIPLSISALYFFPLLFIQILLTTGISFLVSAFNLFYRDIQYVTNLILMVAIYITPVVYPISLVPEKFLFLYKLNPMVGIIEGYKFAILNQPFDINAILYSTVISILVFMVGLSIFKKLERVFADIV